jgi:hypothetical protein
MVKSLGTSVTKQRCRAVILAAKERKRGEDRYPAIFARDRQSTFDLLKLLRSAQQSRYCRGHALAQMGTARFIIAI